MREYVIAAAARAAGTTGLLALAAMSALVMGCAGDASAPASDTGSETVAGGSAGEASGETAPGVGSDKDLGSDSDDPVGEGEDGKSESGATAGADLADLAAVKSYAVDHAAEMKAAAERFRAGAERYHALVAHAAMEHPEQDPYEHIWAMHADDIRSLVEELRADWLDASLHYELNEGIVAGVPSLAYYDAWIDAGPPAEQDPDEAVDWTLILADGTELDSPGNMFHNLTEPALYGTIEGFTALDVDLDGDGSAGIGEVLPEAEILLASAQALDEATARLVEAVDAWQPNLQDAFMALVTMIPTMNEYFEQWKLSAFIGGEEFEETGFIAVSRLTDIDSILTGLRVTFDKVEPLIAEADTDLAQRIDSGFEGLIGYVSDLRAQEEAGVEFGPEEADAFGSEAQSRATALAALVAQAASRTGVALDESAEPWEPDEPPVVLAVAPEPQGFED